MRSYFGSGIFICVPVLYMVNFLIVSLWFILTWSSLGLLGVAMVWGDSNGLMVPVLQTTELFSCVRI